MLNRTNNGEIRKFFRQLIELHSLKSIKSSAYRTGRAKTPLSHSHSSHQGLNFEFNDGPTVHEGLKFEFNEGPTVHEIFTKRTPARKRQREEIIDLTENPGVQHKRARTEPLSTSQVSQFTTRTCSEELSAMISFTNDFIEHFRMFVESRKSNMITEGFRNYVNRLDDPERRVDKEIYGYIRQGRVVNPTIDTHERNTLNKKLTMLKSKMCNHMDRIAVREKQLLTIKGPIQ